MTNHELEELHSIALESLKQLFYLTTKATATSTTHSYTSRSWTFGNNETTQQNLKTSSNTPIAALARHTKASMLN